MKINTERLGDKLREYRKSQGWTQAQMGTKVGPWGSSKRKDAEDWGTTVSCTAIRQFEKGKQIPKIPILLFYSNQLKCSLDELVYGVPHDLPDLTQPFQSLSQPAQDQLCEDLRKKRDTLRKSFGYFSTNIKPTDFDPGLFQGHINALMGNSGMAQEALAKKIGITSRTLRSWTNPCSIIKPQLGGVAAISNHFRLSLDEIVLGYCRDLPESLYPIYAGLFKAQQDELTNFALSQIGEISHHA